MLGQLGQITSLLKNAGKMRENLAAAQERLAAARYQGDAGGGQVQAIVDGRGELVSLKIAPALVQAGDVEMLEDLVSAAVRQAVHMSRESVAKEMQALTGGLNIPGMDELFRGG